MTNTGPFTHNTRVDVLRRLLQAQKESALSLIEADELAIIKEIWTKEENGHPKKTLMPTDMVARIWRHVYEEQAMPNDLEKNSNLDKEDSLLKMACDKHGIPFEMMRQLREIEDEYGHLKRRHGLPEQMREIIQKFLEK